VLVKKFCLALIALCSLNAFALTVDGITFDDKVNVAGKDLVLNGVGIRKATFLKIKVYYGGLYITKKTTDAASFLSTPDPKQIVMHFVRDVEAKDIVKTFKEGLQNANGAETAALMPTMDKLAAQISNIAKNDRMILTFANDGVTLNLKGKSFDKLTDSKFSQGLLKIWFINPADENLSNGLLAK
jgi:hypothetical protein